MRLTAADDANTDLPPAVRARITVLQDNSEKLIGWIQLAIVILFGVLYGLRGRRCRWARRSGC